MNLVTCILSPSERLRKQAEDPASHITPDMLLIGERQFLDFPRLGDQIMDSGGGLWTVVSMTWPEDLATPPILEID